MHSNNFMPHGMCYLWQPGILSLHVISDALIALAYFSIPFTLLYFVRKRGDLQFHWMFVCFAVFIVACGTTHLMEIWTIWNPDYWVTGGIKAVTALASVPTAILLLRLVPQALLLPSPSALESANRALQGEVRERERAEEQVRQINAQLEARVAERTAQLEAMNSQLTGEVERRRQAEESWRSSQNILQTISDNSPAVLYAKDNAGRYLLVSAQFEQLFHVSEKDLLGRTDHDVFPEQDAAAFQRMDRRVMDAGRALTEEETARHADGPHVYVSVKAPLRDAGGKVTGIFGISTDVTEIKQAERALKDSDQKLRSQLARLELLDRITRAIGERQDLHSIFNVVLRSLEDHLPADFVCICLREQVDCVVTAVGPASRGLAGQLNLEPRTRIGVDENGLARCIRGELVYEPDLTLTRAPFPSRLASGGMRALVIAPLVVENNVVGVLVAARQSVDGFSSGECEFLRQLSQHVALASHQAQLYSALQAAYEDLRQSQQTIMQHERLRALGQMASGIAHDINNALSPASLHAQMLMERSSEFSQATRDEIAVIGRAIDDVSRTVARMREFYRVREDTPLGPVKANDTIRQVIELTRARWSAMPQERGAVVEVRTEFAPGEPLIVGAENEIRDALVNLVFNGVDAMPRGGVLTVRSRSAGDQVLLEVSDTGLGMDEKTRSRCLEPFFTTKGERGTGLGLAMVFGMTQRHGAQIEIDSVPGRGTTMRLVFAAHATGLMAATNQEAAEPVRPQALRILVIDDDALVLRTLKSVLSLDGHIVTAAEGGQAGIDEFRVAHAGPDSFALVITDLGMPYVDGRAVAAAIKAMSAATPVLLLTGWGQRLLDEPEAPPNVDRVLSKPPNLRQLRAMIVELAGLPGSGSVT
ncbi:MAG: PAS domain-containing protein [Gammaproteobacteria bacterium]